MSLRDTFITTLLAFLFAPLFILTMQVSFAQVMQSASYKIESDSVNFGGGFSSSTNYVLESTAGEIATGESGSASFNLKAGYQQMTTTFLSMTTPSDVSMSPNIPGISGGTANGSTTVTITTDSSAGYTLTLHASQSPAMQKGGDSIADYVAGTPSFSFAVGVSDAYFGYSPEGADIATAFKDDTGVCGGGSFDTSLACWDGLSTSPEEIARRTSANTPNGSTTTVNFRVGVGSSVVQTAGVYTATTTLTALAL